MSKTITSLQDAIEKEKERMDQAQERLAELSIQASYFVPYLASMSAYIDQADATIASTMDNALSLLQILGCTSEPVNGFSSSWFMNFTSIY